MTNPAADGLSSPTAPARSRASSPIRRGGLPALLIAEADLGERIMRALILRRVGLIETGSGGPVIVGRAGNGDTLRLENFLRRNGHPHQSLDPETDAEARALVEKFNID